MKPIIYTSKDCNICKEIKQIFEKNNICFEEKPVEIAENIVDLYYMGFQELPVVIVGNKSFSGMEALNKCNFIIELCRLV